MYVRGPNVCQGAQYMSGDPMYVRGAQCMSGCLMYVRGPNICLGAQCMSEDPMYVRGPNVCQGVQCMSGFQAQGQHQCTCIRDQMYACACTHKSLRP